MIMIVPVYWYWKYLYYCSRHPPHLRVLYLSTRTDTPLLTRGKRLLKPHLPHVDFTQLVLYIMVDLGTASPPGRSSLSRVTYRVARVWFWIT